MTPVRTTARGLFLTVIAFLLTAGTAAASPSGQVPRLVFPILGAASYTDDFGDPRGQGAHEGNDIVAPRRALVLAAEAGTVKFHTTSARAGCMLYLDGKSGTEYLYVHLNNDLTDGNDNQGKCVAGVSYAKGLKDGAKVAAGEVIAYNGDSGDADGIHPHLHFEVHPSGGGAVSPFPYLNKARRLLFSAERGNDVHARAHAARSRTRPARTSRSRSTRSASGPAGARSSSPARRSPSRCPRRRRSKGSAPPPWCRPTRRSSC